MPEVGGGWSRSTDAITVMTYNVRYASLNDGEHVWRRRRDGVATSVRFFEPDIVGLQEAGYEQVDDLRDRVPELTWLDAGRPGEGSAGEFVALGFDDDRFDLQDDDRFWLSETPAERGSRGWDAKLPRLVRHTEFVDRITEDSFAYFNTHFDHFGQRARLESARLLRRRIEEVASDVPLIVTGDLNCRVSTDPYEHLVDEDAPGRPLYDAHHAANSFHYGPLTTMTDFRNLIPEKKIDYVLTSDDVDASVHAVCANVTNDGRYPSDHLPVLAELSLPAS